MTPGNHRGPGRPAPQLVPAARRTRLDGSKRGSGRLRALTGGSIVALVVFAATVKLSAIPWRPADADRALVRLSWRAVGPGIEECREPDEKENARLPAHMRRAEICEGRMAPFLLVVSVDGRTVLHDTIHAAGARGDRPVYVLREIEVAPGGHDLGVSFDALAADETATARAPGTFPEQLRLDSHFDVGVGETILVTWDEDRRALVLRD